MGKEENAGNQHFLLFPQCFLSYQEQILPLGSPLICRLQTLSVWTDLIFHKSFGKENFIFKVMATVKGFYADK